MTPPVDPVLVLALALRANVPCLLWGAPGVGKTARVRAIARAVTGAEPVVVIAAIREPSDFAGLPVVEGRNVYLAAPAWVREVNELAERHGRAVLFLDEISCAAPAVQAAVLRVLLDRVVGDTPLHPGVLILAAANPPDQAAGGWDLAPPAANRMIHFDWPVPDGVAWAAWLAGAAAPPAAEPLPELGPPGAWTDGRGAKARSLVGAFVGHRRPELLLALPADPVSAGRAWPSPRSWEMATRVLAEAISPEGAVPGDLAATLVASAVGPAAAGELLAWIREADLPDPEELLAHPEAWIPSSTRPDRVWATLAAVATRVLGEARPSKGRWLSAWKLAERAAEMGQGGIAAETIGHPLARARKRPGWESLPIPTEAKAVAKVMSGAEVRY